MPLSESKPKTRKVEFPGGSTEIRGISLSDVAMLIDSHEGVINSIVQKIRVGFFENDAVDDEAMSQLMIDTALEVIRESPIFVANLIAICADEPDQIEVAMKLPLNTTIEAVIAIGEISFTDLASIKKFIASVKVLIRHLLPNESAALAAE